MARGLLPKPHLFGLLSLKWPEDNARPASSPRLVSLAVAGCAQAFLRSEAYPGCGSEALARIAAHRLEKACHAPCPDARVLLRNLGEVVPTLGARGWYRGAQFIRKHEEVRREVSAPETWQRLTESVERARREALALVRAWYRPGDLGRRFREAHGTFIQLNAAKCKLDLQGHLASPEPGEEPEDATRSRETNPSEETLREHQRLPGRKILSWIEAEPVLVIVGEGGGGKSTVGGEVAYGDSVALARQPEGQPPRHAAGQIGEDCARAIAPLFVPAPDLAREIQRTPDRPAVELLQSTAASQYAFPQGIDLDLLLRSGLLRVIVDGINQVSREEIVLGNERTSLYQSLAVKLNTLIAAHPTARWVVTSRILGFKSEDYPHPIATLLRLSPDQIREYLGKTLPDEAAAESLGNAILDEQAPRSLRDLAESPLFLSMIVESPEAREGRPPESLGDLFEQFTRRALERLVRGEAAGPHAEALQVPVEAKRLMLAALAARLVTEIRGTELPFADGRQRLLDAAPADVEAQRALDEIMLSELVEEAAASSGEANILRFRHQSFQEYFAASQFERWLGDGSQDVHALLSKRANRESLVFLVGFSRPGQTQVHDLLGASLAYDVQLAARCLRQTEHAPAVLRARFLEAMEARARDPNEGKHTRTGAVEALGTLSCRRSLEILFGLAASRDPLLAPRALEVLSRLSGDPHAQRAWTATGAGSGLRQRVGEALEAALGLGHPTLAAAAARLIGQGHHNQLAVALASVLHETGDWQILRACFEALDALGQVLAPGSLVERRLVDGAVKRLGELRVELSLVATREVPPPHPDSSDHIDALREEEAELVGLLAARPTKTGLEAITPRLIEVGAERTQEAFEARLCDDALARIAHLDGETPLIARLLVQAKVGVRDTARARLKLVRGLIRDGLRASGPVLAAAAYACAKLAFKRQAKEMLDQRLDLCEGPDLLVACAHLAECFHLHRCGQRLARAARRFWEKLPDFEARMAISKARDALLELDKVESWMLFAETRVASHDKGCVGYPTSWASAQFGTNEVLEAAERLLQRQGSVSDRAAAELLSRLGVQAWQESEYEKPSGRARPLLVLYVRVFSEALQRRDLATCYDCVIASIALPCPEVLPYVVKLLQAPEAWTYRQDPASVILAEWCACAAGVLAFVLREEFPTEVKETQALLRACLERPDSTSHVRASFAFGLLLTGDWQPVIREAQARASWPSEVQRLLIDERSPEERRTIAREIQAWLLQEKRPEARDQLRKLLEELGESLDELFADPTLEREAGA